MVPPVARPPSPPTGGVHVGACPGCKARERRRWHRHAEVTLWLCARCGLGYSDPQPRAAVQRRYLSDYDLAEHFGAHEQRKAVLTARRLDRLPQPRAGQRLLDVGCGDGQFAVAAAVRGWDVSGVELNPPAAQRTRERGIAVFEGRLEDVDYAPGTFDVVAAWDVLEHVPEPRVFVEHLTRLVASGGLVVLTTLNRNALVARVFRGGWSMVAIDHFTYWHARSLHVAFARSGLRAVRTTSFGLGRDFVFWMDRLRRRPGWTATADAAPVVAPARGRAAGWDTQPRVLSAERVLNRFLAATSLGVGVEVAFRAPPAASQGR